MARGRRAELAEKIAGEVALSDDPGGTLRKWRTDFEVAQTELADELAVSPSVVSDYESGRRENPGIGVVKRVVEALLDIDDRRGGSHIRQHARVLSAGFDAEIVHDLREYQTAVPLKRFYAAIGATSISNGPQGTVTGHTVIDSIEAISRLSPEEFYRLYGQSTNRALVFTNATSGEGHTIALRVMNPTPNAVVLQGIGEDSVWEHAAELSRIDGYSLAVCPSGLDEMLGDLRELA
jgi:putative transcriptional regulator